MGHKVHPIGLRLGIHRKWKSNWFFESKNYPKFIHLNLNIEKFFRGFLYFRGIKTLLLNCQIIKLPSNQIFIFVFHYRFRKKRKKNFYKWRLRKWQENLENIFLKRKKKIKIDLNKRFLTYYKAKHEKVYLKKFLKLKDNQGFDFSKLPKNFLLKNLKNTSQIYYNNLKDLQNIYSNLKTNIKDIHFIKNIKKKKFIIKYLKNLKLKTIILRCSLVQLKKIYLKKKSIFQIYKWFTFKYCYLQYYNLSKLKNNYKLFYTLTMGFKNKEFIQKFIKYFYWVKKKSNLKCTLIGKKLNLKLRRKLKKKYFLKRYKCKIIKKNKLLTKKNYYNTLGDIKRFLTKITNCKINLIFINALSFTKFFYMIGYIDKRDNTKKREKFNVLQIQKNMINRYKYSAIFIKDFVHLAFISALLKNTQTLVKFMGEQFKRLPKNRKQLRLLRFLQQSLKIFCRQRKEFIGFKLQIKGRLNRRNRTNKWNFNQGILPTQTNITRIEYGYSEGLTRSGLIGIKLWFFYKQQFKNTLKTKLIQYLYYSKYKKFLNKLLVKKINKYSHFSKNNIKKPEFKKPEVKKPEVKKPNFKKPNFKNTKINSNVKTQPKEI